MKPLWFVEKDAFGWTINCRFMLGGKRAGVAQLISVGEYNHANDPLELVTEAITFLDWRREDFIAKEVA